MNKQKTALVVGAGPAGLMAAERLAQAGVKVTVFDRMPSPARKFLLAGRGGLNLTHAEPFEAFAARYGAASVALRPFLEAFPPAALRQWCEDLGVPTFEGSSGRIFPQAMKASPLLRAWLRRLQGMGIDMASRMTLDRLSSGRATFIDSDGAPVEHRADVIVLALGGASWPRLGSDGSWTTMLAEPGVSLSPLRPSNCGFDVAWSPWFRDRFAGTPLKNIGLTFGDRTLRGEAMIADYGIEGGAIYTLSGALRDTIDTDDAANLSLDLRPDLPAERLLQRLSAPRGKASMASHLRKAAGLSPVAAALLREPGALPSDPAALVARIKNLPLRLLAARPIAHAISSAGGVTFDALDDGLMLKNLPGVFVAGEMLDWEAPTGGYLLQACLSTGRAAGDAAARWALADTMTREKTPVGL